jgi:hypothetical protein
MELVDLIARASEATGSDYKLAKSLGVTPQVVSDWKHGRRTCTPEDWALLAYIAGLDPEEALIRAVVAKHADTPKGERLLTALGKGLRVTGVAASIAICASAGSLLTVTDARAKTAEVKAQRCATMYIRTIRKIRKRSKALQLALCKKQPIRSNARHWWAFSFGWP